jgi:hypothetical protein
MEGGTPGGGDTSGRFENNKTIKTRDLTEECFQ